MARYHISIPYWFHGEVEAESEDEAWELIHDVELKMGDQYEGEEVIELIVEEG